MSTIEPLERRNLFNTLIVQGTAGNDEIAISVQKETIVAVLNGTPTFWVDDLYDAIEVQGLGGNDAIVIFESGDNDIFVYGDDPAGPGPGDGDDTIDIANGNLDMVLAPVVVHGGGGDDVVRLNDQNNLFSDPFTITSTTAGRFFFGGLTYTSDLESLIVRNSSRSSTITVASTSPTTRVRIDSGAGDDTINVNETDPATPVQILPAQGNDQINVNTDGIGSAAVRFEATHRILGLSIGAGGIATIAPAPAGDRVLTMAQLSIAEGGRFDLANNAAVIDYAGASPIAAVGVHLTSGYNDGGWNGGSGIVSSAAAASTTTAIGYAEASDLFTSFPASFAGTTVDATAVLLRYTRYGDADLNRVVNLADFNRLAASFGQINRRWSQGDFNFDGNVNLSDFNRLAANFGTSLAPADDRDPDERFF